MCNYCGCREFPLIGRLSAEHEAITDAAGRLRSAVRGGGADPLAALDALLALLVPHTRTEEDGLFAELRAEGSLAEAVRRLCAEHDDIHGVLGAVDRAAPDWPPVLAALDRLHRHVDNEEHGLFPAAVIALPIPAWDRITPTVISGPSARFLGGIAPAR
ncbi:hemerythrin domain-containing protein [Micromonospora chersina]|uniref:hemerythrin domain-containing protein n=1 Tax=Micromonospora chersina TaxID=47854 RepID=UPI003CB04ECF